MMCAQKEILNSLLIFSLLAGVFPPLRAENSGQKNTADIIQAHTHLEPLRFHPRTSLTIVEQLRYGHFLSDEKRINNELSSAIFDKYVSMLDRNKAYFTRQDLNTFEKYRFELDEALRRGDLNPAFTIFNVYRERLLERSGFLVEEIKQGLSAIKFDLKDSIETDRENSPWAANDNELDIYWKKRLKASALAMVLNGKTIDEIEELMVKRYTNRLKQAQKTNSEDAFQLYVNAFANTYDPHTQYFSPKTSRNFDINMSLSLEGIGAVLRGEDDYTSVIELVPAGPAEKSGLIKPTDKIISVGQGDDGPLIDIVGWRLDDVVELIRGPKGSRVRLEILKAGPETGTSEVIKIVRNKVELEEQAAQKAVLILKEGEENRKIGIIRIPTFYLDFKGVQQGDPNYRSSTKDVKRLIDDLKKESIDGLIIDLRNNGGGSLQEADALTGLFINSGPTVQVKASSRRQSVYKDTDNTTAWDGPLAVVVNRLSASASEIFAGAIQDYERGIIIGSQTFGKGTVQTLVPLARGQLKITAAKFYRVSGESTQHQGIIPDITFPNTYDADQVGESALEDAMLWDQIEPANYTSYNSITPVLKRLRILHQDRVASNPDFLYLKALSGKLKENKDRTTVSLNKEYRKREKAAQDAWRIDLENKLRTAKGQELISSMDEITNDEASLKQDPTTDPLLRETGNILLDYIGLSNTTLNSEDDGESNFAIDSTAKKSLTGGFK